jgi:hypothetical protein
MTTRKIKCSTKCPLGGMQRDTLGGILEDFRPVEGKTFLRDSPVKKTDTADEQNTAAKDITKKNPRAGIQGRECKI